MKSWTVRGLGGAFWMAGLLLSLLTTGAAAQTSGAHETWNLASMEDFVPFNYARDESYVGIDVEILEEMARRLDVRLRHHPLPWRRAILEFEAGRFDALFQLAMTQERERDYVMVGPLRQTRTVWMVRKDDPVHDIPDYASLRDRVIGLVSGFMYSPAFNSETSLRKEYSSDDAANIRKLLMGRTDVIVGGSETLVFVAKALGVSDQLRILPTPLTVQNRYIAFHRTPEGLERAARCQAVLDQMSASGRTIQIVHAFLNR
ncbi:substrate-binding periplasmic protein [Arenibacterium sp. LLYu02]|uniref:substrate-binding periplasmic protein n=1 Tax=Arenibacterium sp. LLYu02 TaxID=3404132 RepID=UPI003B20E4BB